VIGRCVDADPGSGDAGVRRLDVDGAVLAYTVQGRGPALLIPLCNVDWSTAPAIGRLAEHFTVIVAAPRGFWSSTWPADGGYDIARMCDDLLAVCSEVGADRFSVLGYSLTGTLSLRLAAHDERVDAVVAGGFPFLADWTRLLADVEARTGAESGDPEQEAQLSTQLGFDVRAARAFYDELASLPTGALLDDVDVPVLTFWGAADEVIEQFEGREHLESLVRDRGIGYHVVPGTDHAGTLLAVDGLLPTLIEWLRGAGAST
jgi:pimeloyl-ACP methyl ester carboxylesterase